MRIIALHDNVNQFCVILFYALTRLYLQRSQQVLYRLLALPIG